MVQSFWVYEQKLHLFLNIFFMHFHRSQYDTSIVQLWILLHAEKRGLQRSVLDQPARFIDKRWHQPKHSLVLLPDTD